MQLSEAILQALHAAWSHKLRSFFTLLGIIVSVAFLVAVVAIIQGMNAYVRERIGGAIVGANAFQVRRTPIAVGLIDDEEWKAIQRRPIIAPEDVPFVRRAIPDARAIALQSGWPTPQADIVWRDKTVGDVFVFGVTAPFQVVQDYQFAAGEPLSDIDVRERRPVVELGYDIADRVFDYPDQAIGEKIRILGQQYTVKGVVAKKGNVLGQSWDGFVMMPLTSFEALYGRRKTTVISVKMPEAALVADGMQRAEEAMRIAHRLRPGQPDDFTVDTADALVSFWKNLTRLLFTVIPAVVAIGIIVGGIVIMNIMLMSVNERTREIGIRKSLGARRRDIRNQFLAEAVTLAVLGGVLGLLAGTALAELVNALSPLPARVTAWSVVVALGAHDPGRGDRGRHRDGDGLDRPGNPGPDHQYHRGRGADDVLRGTRLLADAAQPGRPAQGSPHPPRREGGGGGSDRAAPRDPLLGDLGAAVPEDGVPGHPHPDHDAVRRGRPLHGDPGRPAAGWAVLLSGGAERRRAGHRTGAQGSREAVRARDPARPLCAARRQVAARHRDVPESGEQLPAAVAGSRRHPCLRDGAPLLPL